MWKYISLMMICCTANAGMYSCVDDGGKKVLRSSPCEQNEKQQPIVIKADPSYYVINSTGEKHGIDSYHAKQAQETIAQSAAQKSTVSSQPIDRKQSNSQELMETGGIGGAVEARRSIDSQEHARELMQTGGIGGAVEARMYMDMENSDDSEYQQQRELRKMKKELQRMNTQKIIDSYTAH